MYSVLILQDKCAQLLTKDEILDSQVSRIISSFIDFKCLYIITVQQPTIKITEEI